MPVLESCRWYCELDDYTDARLEEVNLSIFSLSRSKPFTLAAIISLKVFTARSAIPEGAEEIIEKREQVDQEIADYFKQVYQRPAHMSANGP